MDRSGGPVFDPFGDRLSRDIRNTLSSALIAELGGEPGAVEMKASVWLSRTSHPVYRDYIRGRQALYHRTIARIRSARIDDPRRQAVMLWNAGLFFELHELLETIWLKSPPCERTAIKGLIQAAGVYVHLQHRNAAAGRKLAAKARLNLSGGGACLTFIANLSTLLKEMNDPCDPPRLEGAPPEQSE